MKSHLDSTTRGIAHIALPLVLLVIIGVAASSYAVYRHNIATDYNGVSNSYKRALKNAKCLVADANLCKFFTASKLSQNYTAEATITQNGSASSTTYKADGQDKFHLIASDGYEVIGLSKSVIYTYSTADDIWWQQAIDKKYFDAFKGGNVYAFEEPRVSSTALQTSYQPASTEDCFGRTCLKYQVTNPTMPSDLEYIWFDTSTYRLQRLRISTAGATRDVQFTYGNAALGVPSPTKEVGANQVVLPGNSEPTTLSSAADVANALDQALPVPQ